MTTFYPDCDYCGGYAIVQVADDSPIGYAQVCRAHFRKKDRDMVIARSTEYGWVAA